jgi:hypothetical protein
MRVGVSFAVVYLLAVMITSLWRRMLGWLPAAG